MLTTDRETIVTADAGAKRASAMVCISSHRQSPLL